MRKNETGYFDPDFEPLAAFLEPHFGNIYGSIGYAWTPELKATIKDFLILSVALDSDVDLDTNGLPLHLPNELRNAEVDSSQLRLAQTDYIIENYLPYQIAHAFHDLAVMSTVSLRDIIGDQTDAWESADDEDDASLWLETMTTYDQLTSLARLAGLSSDIPRKKPVPGSAKDDEIRRDLAELVVASISPRELARAWDSIAGEPTPGLNEL